MATTHNKPPLRSGQPHGGNLPDGVPGPIKAIAHGVKSAFWADDPNQFFGYRKRKPREKRSGR